MEGATEMGWLAGGSGVPVPLGTGQAGKLAWSGYLSLCWCYWSWSSRGRLWVLIPRSEIRCRVFGQLQSHVQLRQISVSNTTQVCPDVEDGGREGRCRVRFSLLLAKQIFPSLMREKAA